jgi:cell division septation protein DedD
VKYLIAILLLSTQPVFAQNAESGKQGAIGIRYTRNAEGMIVVKYVEDKSPAAQAGIQVNDVMISIDGSSLRGMDPANIKNVLRGKVGSAVEIKLENSQTRAEYSASVVRRIVQFGAGDPLKYATKNNTQAEVKNDSKTAASPQLEAPKMSAKPSEKTPSPPAPITPSKTGAEQASATTTSASAASTTPSNSKYFIQTGAFFTKEIANDQVTSFNQKGYASFVDPAVINGSNVYRVRIGPLTTQQSVDALSKKLASQGITNSIIEAAPTTAKN